MKCKVCGKELAEGSKFCNGCGSAVGNDVSAEVVVETVPGASAEASVEDGADDTIEVSVEDESEDTAEVSSENETEIASTNNTIAEKEDDVETSDVHESMPKKKFNPLIVVALAIWGAILTIVLYLIIGAAATSAKVNPKKPIDLDSYVEVTVSGYDGYANASVSIDWDSFDEDNQKKYKLTKVAKQKLGSNAKTMPFSELIKDYVEVSLDKTSNISNGDKLKYNWVISDALYEYVECYFEYGDESYSVSGLQSANTYDFFSELDLSFSGISPSGVVDVTYSGDRLSKNDFVLDKTNNIKNGDVITVSLYYTDEWYYLSNFDVVPVEYTKQYVVSGLDEYICSVDDIPEDSLAYMKSEASDYILSYIARSYNSGVATTDLEYMGYIINCVKEYSGYGDHNSLYIIYRSAVSISSGAFRETYIYYPVKFDNLIVKADGFSYENIDEIVNNSYIDGSYYYSRGYVNPCTCYSDLVTSKMDKYDVECGDGFEIFTDCEVISSLDSMSVEYRQQMIEEALDKVDSYLASRNVYLASTSAQLVGEYLLTAKSQGTNYAQNNRYVIVLSAEVSGKSGKNTFSAETVYFPVLYEGVLKMPNGEYVISDDQDGILGFVHLYGNPLNSYGTKGYNDGEKMYSDIITANRDNYTYEVSEGLLQFGE